MTGIYPTLAPVLSPFVNNYFSCTLKWKQNVLLKTHNYLLSACTQKLNRFIISVHSETEQIYYQRALRNWTDLLSACTQKLNRFIISVHSETEQIYYQRALRNWTDEGERLTRTEKRLSLTLMHRYTFKNVFRL